MTEMKENAGVALAGILRPAVFFRLRELASDWLLPSRTLQRRFWPLGIGLGYILLIAALGGLSLNHVLLGLLGLLDLYNERTRAFLRHFLPFILTGVAFDMMRYFYWEGIEGHVHVAEPYRLDLAWFGVPALVDGVTKRVTPNEFFQIHTSVVLDLACGFAYLSFVAEYLSAAFYLFFRGHWKWLTYFGWAFFVVNLMGFITYFVYPAAPPWYVTRYGLGPAAMRVLPNPAGAQRFDQFFGTHFFDEVYGHGIDVYGAYPSLHVAYPFLVAWLAFQLPELKWVRIPAIAFYLLMCLSAVYLQHHYVVDILLGTAYSIGVLLFLNHWLGAREAS